MTISHDTAAPTAPSEESLRDRKARLTRRAIHVATVNQVHAHGLDQATIAQIAAEAGVSTRTFFNYFASKEDAIVGIADRLLDDEQIGDFLVGPVDGAGLASEVARLLHTAFLLTFNDDEVASARRRIFAQHPELLGRQFEKNRQLESQVAEVVATRIRQHDIEFDTAESPEAIADMIVLVCSAPLRAAARRLAERDDSGADTGDDPELFDRSVQLFLDVMKGPTA